MSKLSADRHGCRRLRSDGDGLIAGLSRRRHRMERNVRRVVLKFTKDKYRGFRVASLVRKTSRDSRPRIDRDCRAQLLVAVPGVGKPEGVRRRNGGCRQSEVRRTFESRISVESTCERRTGWRRTFAVRPRSRHQLSEVRHRRLVLGDRQRARRLA